MYRRKKTYFKHTHNTPRPLTVEIKRRVRFHEVDTMDVVWFGRYFEYFQEGIDELGRKYGFSFNKLDKVNIKVPIVQAHTDYFLPLRQNELFTITASFIWPESTKINTEFVIRKENGDIAATGYKVQIFIDAQTGEVVLDIPDFIKNIKTRWAAGVL